MTRAIDVDTATLHSQISNRCGYMRLWEPRMISEEEEEEENYVMDERKPNVRRSTCVILLRDLVG
jgi:hypothetical protein